MKRCCLVRLFLIGLVFSSGPVTAQTFLFEQGRDRDAIRFDLVHNLIIIPIYINGAGPFNFILDTGVGPMVITDPGLGELVESSSQPLFRMRGRGIGSELEAYVVNNLTAQVGKATMSGFSGVLLKNDPFQISAYLGTSVHGIMGSLFFKSFIVKVDYVDRKLSFYHPSHSVRKRGEKIPIDFIRDKPYTNVVVKTLDGKTDTLSMLVDSGAGHVISLDLDGGKPWLKPENTLAANLGMGLSGPISGWVGRMSEVELGVINFKNVIVAFPEYEDENLRLLMTENDGSIGGGLLKRFTVWFDYSRQEMHLKRNRYYKMPFEHDMSGMEIYRADKKRKRFIVSRIEPDSPAEKAEFKTGDEILSINFKDAKTYTLEEINGLLQKETSSVLVFEVLRDRQTLFKVLSLKRRI